MLGRKNTFLNSNALILSLLSLVLYQFEIAIPKTLEIFREPETLGEGMLLEINSVTLKQQTKIMGAMSEKLTVSHIKNRGDY